MVEETLHHGNCIRTVTGLYVDIFNPKPEMFCLMDKAHALSMIPRFGGHLREFYSVAQHCVLGAHLIAQPFKYMFLMHDWTEAYMLDMPRPIKKKIQGYKETENRLMELINPTLGIPYPFPAQIKEMDNYMLEWEHSCLVLRESKMDKIECWSPDRAKHEFLAAYKKYKPNGQ